MHIMLDLETWGLTPGSDIRSIGAVVFDPVAGYVAIPSGDENNDSKSFYIATDNPAHPGPDADFSGWHFDACSGEYRKYPLTRDPGTVKWWNEQTAEAQAAFANPHDLADAAVMFSRWLIDQIGRDINRIQEIRLWANGPQFDIAILAAVYRAVGLPIPWHYRAPRDMRTIADAAGMTKEEFCNYGDAHNALHDAIAQAMTVCEAYRRLDFTA